MIRRVLLEDLGGHDETLCCQDGYGLWVRFYYRPHGSDLTLGLESEEMFRDVGVVATIKMGLAGPLASARTVS